MNHIISENRSFLNNLGNKHHAYWPTTYMICCHIWLEFFYYYFFNIEIYIIFFCTLRSYFRIKSTSRDSSKLILQGLGSCSSSMSITTTVPSKQEHQVVVVSPSLSDKRILVHLILSNHDTQTKTWLVNSYTYSLFYCFVIFLLDKAKNRYKVDKSTFE